MDNETRRPPTNRALSAWYAAQPTGNRTCADCGKVGSSHYVQPQHPFWAEGLEDVARCVDCIGRRIEAGNLRRKAQLAAEPRCEIHGCTRRGAWHVGIGRVLLCGGHKKRAERAFYSEAAGSGMAWLYNGETSTRSEVIRLAGGGGR